MIELKGDIFQLFETGQYDGICITTNGMIKNDGTAVMGRGIAKIAKEKYNGIERRLAQKLKESGNKLYQLGKTEHGAVISYPTKHNWQDKSDIRLIIQSARQLIELCDRKEYSKILTTRFGCGNGWLQWHEVKPFIEHILDDRIIVVDNG